MNREELKAFLEKSFPNFKIEETANFPVLIVEAGTILDTATHLKNNTETRFDFLFCQTAVDRKTHLEVVYHITSTTYRHDLVLKVLLEQRNMPEISSVTSVWKAAELYENEIFDLFGIKFANHPDLRRIFLGDNWKGFPLLKDYNYEGNDLVI